MTLLFQLPPFSARLFWDEQEQPKLGYAWMAKYLESFKSYGISLTDARNGNVSWAHPTQRRSTFREGWHLQKWWFFGKVPNGLWSPPLIFGKSCCAFFPEYMTEEAFIMAKICNINFWIGNDPPPLLELFQKFISFGDAALPFQIVQHVEQGNLRIQRSSHQDIMLNSV